jgi:hypothetical protein
LRSIGYFERRYHQAKNMTDIDPDLVERTRRYLIAKPGLDASVTQTAQTAPDQPPQLPPASGTAFATTATAR